MKKPALALALVTIVVIIVSIFVVPRLRLASLEKSLYLEPNTKNKAAIARKILKSKSKQGLIALQKYAEQDSLIAFDPIRHLLLLGDESDGSVHIAYVDPQNISSVVSRSISFGEPPILFEGIHLLNTEENQANFVLKPKSGDHWLRLSFEFNQGNYHSISYDVTDAELDLWQKNENWPEAWKRDSEKSDINSSADDAD